MQGAPRGEIVRYRLPDRALKHASGRGNLLLETLPAVVAETLYRGNPPVELQAGERLRYTRDGRRLVIFPMSCLASQYVRMDDGMTAEIASVGREGMLGLGSFLNAMATEPEAMAAVPGLALPVEVEQVQAVLADVPEFALVLLRYAAVHLAMVGHTSACGRLHDTRSRLARWLLLMDDRQVAQTTSLTHETLAEVLGVRRPSVTIAASQLQRAGCLRYTRGHMEILDRAQLIRWSCECYVPMRESLASMVAHYAA